MSFNQFAKYALWFLTSLSLLATALVSKELLFPFITTKAFFFRAVLELALPFYVYLILSDKTLRPNLKNPLNLLALLFLAANLLSGLLGVNPARSLWGNFERMGGAYYLAHLVLLYFYVLSLGQISGRYIQNFIKVLLGISALIALNGFSGMLGGPTLTVDPSLPTRASSTLGNPIFLASFLIFPMFFSVFFAVQSQKPSARWGYALLTLLQMIGIFQSGTRGAVVGLILGLFFAVLVFVFLSADKRVRKFGLIGILAFILAVGLLYSFHERLPVGTPLWRVFNLRDTNASARLIQWRVAVQGAKDFPWLGAGPENYYLIGNKYYNNELYRYDRSWFDKPHNYLLEILTTGGMLGLGLYLGILIYALYILWRAFRLEVLSLFESCVFLAAILVYQIQNLFVFDTIPASLMFYAFLGFVSFLHFETSRSGAKKEKPALKNGLPLNFARAGFGVCAIVAIYLVVATNIMPAKASRSVNYGYAYANADPYKAAEYFKTAATLPFNFDDSETGSKYSGFAASLVSAPPASSDPAFVEKQLAAALAYEIKAAESSPNDPVVLQQLANIYFYSSIFHKSPIPAPAVLALQKAIALAPKRVEARLALAQLRLFQGFPKEAAEIAEAASNLDPTNKQTKWQLALVYQDAGRQTEAVELAERMLAEGYESYNPADVSWLIDYYVLENKIDKALNLAEKNLKSQRAGVGDVAKLYKVYKAFGMEGEADRLIGQFKKVQPEAWPELEKLIRPESADGSRNPLKN